MWLGQRGCHGYTCIVKNPSPRYLTRYLESVGGEGVAILDALSGNASKENCFGHSGLTHGYGNRHLFEKTKYCLISTGSTLTQLPFSLLRKSLIGVLNCEVKHKIRVA